MAMRNLLDEVRLMSDKALWKPLDGSFKDFSMMSPSSFPDDEFDAEEQRLLSKLLAAVGKWGYARLFHRLANSNAGQQIIDTTAGYGEFVDTEDCVSYLGIFVAAEAVQYPFATDSYAFSLVRSACFRNLNQDEKIKILRLMHLAKFLRDIDLSDELELGMYSMT